MLRPRHVVRSWLGYSRLDRGQLGDELRRSVKVLDASGLGNRPRDDALRRLHVFFCVLLERRQLGTLATDLFRQSGDVRLRSQVLSLERRQAQQSLTDLEAVMGDGAAFPADKAESVLQVLVEQPLDVHPQSPSIVGSFLLRSSRAPFDMTSEVALDCDCVPRVGSVWSS